MEQHSAEISLSSGEAEYYGVVKAAGIALGHQSLMAEMGMSARVRVWTDSSAAIGICGRSGLGKLRHVQTHTLWVQERVRSGAIELRKVNGLVNPADLFTKHLTSRDSVNQLIELFNCEYREGRSAAAPELRQDREPAAAHAVQHDYDPEVNNKSPMHDPDILPHMYDIEEMSKTFETAVAQQIWTVPPRASAYAAALNVGNVVRRALMSSVHRSSIRRRGLSINK